MLAPFFESSNSIIVGSVANLWEIYSTSIPLISPWRWRHDGAKTQENRQRLQQNAAVWNSAPLRPTGPWKQQLVSESGPSPSRGLWPWKRVFSWSPFLFVQTSFYHLNLWQLLHMNLPRHHPTSFCPEDGGSIYLRISHYYIPNWGHAVVVEALCYNPEGRGFQTRRCEWFFFFFSIYLILPAALGPGVHSTSNRNEHQKQKNNISREYSADDA
jgi:hypothetical protein